MDDVYEFAFLTNHKVFCGPDEVAQNPDSLLLSVVNWFHLIDFPIELRNSVEETRNRLQDVLMKYGFIDSGSRFFDDQVQDADLELLSKTVGQEVVSIDRRNLNNPLFLLDTMDRSMFSDDTIASLSRQMTCVIDSHYPSIRDIEDGVSNRYVIYFQIFRMRLITMDLTNQQTPHLMSIEEYENA